MAHSGTPFYCRTATGNDEMIVKTRYENVPSRCDPSSGYHPRLRCISFMRGSGQLAASHVRESVGSSWGRKREGSVLGIQEMPGFRADVLPAGEEAAGLGHLVTVLPVSADAEGDGRNTDNKGAHDRSVRLPVARLSVPTTRGGPNFLGVPIQQNLLASSHQLAAIVKHTGSFHLHPL